MEGNAVNWFEIPVSDMVRAVRFYETVFDVKLTVHTFGPLVMAWFPEAKGQPGSPGSLVLSKENYKPSTDGVLIYFTSRSGDLLNELDRVEKAGGLILLSKTQISDEYGFMALFRDSEGNRVALHSQK